jgi:hypothetical protein
MSIRYPLKIFKKIFLKKKVAFSLDKKKRVYVFGDSHTQVFNYINDKQICDVKFIVTRVDGATAMGMVNPNSHTNALPKFLSEIEKISKIKCLIFLLGEVDCGFLIWHRNQSLGLDINKQLKKSVENYSFFLKKILMKGYKNIFVISSPLPSIKDEYIDQQTTELRRHIIIPLSTRTELSLKYNKELKIICLDNNVNYIDLDEDLYDTENKILKQKYFDEDPLEHHLNSRIYSNLILTHLQANKIV